MEQPIEVTRGGDRRPCLLPGAPRKASRLATTWKCEDKLALLPKQVIGQRQAWLRTDAWGEGEREAEGDLGAVRGERFDTLADLSADLDEGSRVELIRVANWDHASVSR